MERLQLSSELRHLKTVRRWIGKICLDAGLDEEQVSDMQLVVGEAFTNGVEHGYRYEPDGTISLTARVRSGFLEITVRDRGRSLDISKMKDPDLSRPHEGGYGLYLMCQLTDRFDIHVDDPPGTEVVLMKKVGPATEKEPGKVLSLAEELFKGLTP